MKNILTLTAISAFVAGAFTGCQSSATEAEKQQFSNRVLQNENQQEQQDFDNTIEPGYQSEGVGQEPDWEMPAN